MPTRRRCHGQGQGRTDPRAEHPRAATRVGEAGDPVSAADGRPRRRDGGVRARHSRTCSTAPAESSASRQRPAAASRDSSPRSSRNLVARGVTVAWGEAQNFGRTTSYLVWRDVWRTLLEVDDDATEASQGRALTRRLRAISGDHARRGPLLAAVRRYRHGRQRADALVRREAPQDIVGVTARRRARARVPPTARLPSSSRTATGSTRSRATSSKSWSSRRRQLPVLFVLAYRPADEPGGGLGLDRVSVLPGASPRRARQPSDAAPGAAGQAGAAVR